MKIRIVTIPHEKQRHGECGDWQWDREKQDTLVIRVSKTRGDYEALVAVHELIEALLCQATGIPEKLVDVWDAEMQKRRQRTLEQGGTPPEIEFGDYREAPYYRPHQIASAIERILAAEMGVSWLEYEKALDALA